MDTIARSDSAPRLPITVVIVFGTLVLAIALSLTAVAQVLDEYRMLGAWLDRPDPPSAWEIELFRKEIGARIVVRSLALVVLLLCTLATFWLQQRQLAVRRALDQVRLMASDILSSLKDGVITTDGEGKVSSINAAAIGLIGVEGDAIGKPIAAVSRPDLPLVDLARAITERRGDPSDRELALDREGRPCRLVLGGSELKDVRGATVGCVIQIRDVTERMLMKEQMWRLEQFSSLSTMASGLLHEIQNPMTALSIHVQLLEERLRDESIRGQVAELIGVLKTEVRRLSNTLSSFRDFAGQDRLRLKPTDVSRVLHDVVRLIHPQAEGQHVRLKLLPLEPDLPQVELDPEKFEQAILNLVLNALEAMPRGGSLNLGARVGAGLLRVSVEDDGPGIPAEIQDHVFRPYFSTKENGTGMGIPLAEKLIRQHRGRLDFRTSPRGTTFTITLPLTGRVESEAP